MPDQAAGLRSLFAKRRPALLIVVGSDTHKASVAVHFARESASGGRATVLIDGTTGGVAAACNVACRYELSHVLAGDVPLADVIRPLTRHLLLLPAARALSRLDALDAREEARLAETFSSGIAEALARGGADGAQVDLIVVNADAGRATAAVEAFGRDARIVVVASGQVESLRGAYLELKALSQGPGIEQFEIVEPGTEDAGTGLAFRNLSAAARRFLDIELVDGGRVATDRVVPSDRTDTLRPPTNTAAFHSHQSTNEVHHAAAVA